MALVNAYIQASDLTGHLPSMDDATGENTVQIERAINAASRAIDQHSNRRFYADADPTARRFHANRWDLVRVDDISTTTGLAVAVDTTDDGTFNETWATTDYELAPINAISSSGEAWPYTSIRAVESRCFPTRHRRAAVEVTARWGWPSGPPAAVIEACLLLSARLYRRRQSPEGVIGFGEFGTVRLSRTDPDIAMMLKPYKIDPVMVG